MANKYTARAKSNGPKTDPWSNALNSCIFIVKFVTAVFALLPHTVDVRISVVDTAVDLAYVAAVGFPLPQGVSSAAPELPFLATIMRPLLSSFYIMYYRTRQIIRGGNFCGWMQNSQFTGKHSW